MTSLMERETTEVSQKFTFYHMDLGIFFTIFSVKLELSICDTNVSLVYLYCGCNRETRTSLLMWGWDPDTKLENLRSKGKQQWEGKRKDVVRRYGTSSTKKSGEQPATVRKLGGCWRLEENAWVMLTRQGSSSWTRQFWIQLSLNSALQKWQWSNVTRLRSRVFYFFPSVLYYLIKTMSVMNGGKSYDDGLLMKSKFPLIQGL